MVDRQRLQQHLTPIWTASSSCSVTGYEDITGWGQQERQDDGKTDTEKKQRDFLKRTLSPLLQTGIVVGQWVGGCLLKYDDQRQEQE